MSSINMICGNLACLGIRVEFDQPWFLVLAIPAVAIIMFPFFLLPKERRKSFKKIFPLVCHTVIVVILVLLVAGARFVLSSNEEAVVILVDTSYSTVGVKDEIEKNAREIYELIDRNTPVGVVAFGDDTVYCVDMNSIDKGFKLDAASERATDISSALDYCASLAPTDKALRIIILSDGKQTEGDGDSKAYHLANTGVRVDAMYFDTTQISTPEMQISSFVCPVGCYLNETASFSVEVKSNIEQTVSLKLYENGNVIDSREIILKKGSVALELDVTPGSTGSNKYEVRLEGGQDTVGKNNAMTGIMRVDDRPSILIIADEIESVEPLKKLLSAKNNVDVVKDYDAPETLVELCKYDQVILSNVNAYIFTNRFIKALDAFASVYGRSVLTLGGRDTYMFGGMKDSELEKMLPISCSFDETDSQSSVALMLVLDCSRSMGGSNDYLTIAKQGAIKSLDALTDKDYVGVVSFSTDAHLESGLVRATQTNKDALSRTISGITISSGTYYEAALKLAYDQLSQSDADIKHILFLSDGQPVDNGYDEVVIKASEEGITVSTIGLAFSSTVLEYMAMYGKGRYYYVASASELPDVMLSEAEQARVDPLIEKEFSLVVGESSPYTDGIDFDKLPTLDGYIGTTLKENAKALLINDNNHPIYASWSYGKGVVSSFTSDLCGKWSSRWYGNTEGENAILSMIKSTVGQMHGGTSLIVDGNIEGDTLELFVNTATANSNNKVYAKLESDKGEQTVELVSVYSGFYKGELSILNEGVYTLTVEEKNVIQSTVDTAELGICKGYSGEYDMFSSGGEALLAGMCEYSQGKIHKTAAEIAAVRSNGIEKGFDPVVPLAIIAALLFVIDIAVRKLRLKDIAKYLPVLDKLGKK